MTRAFPALAMRWLSALALAATPLFASQASAAPVSVVDDAGARIELAAPAQRIIALAPHVVEMLYAAGGGERLVATVDHADYPPAARELPRIGNNRALDIERIIALRPDLIVVWRHGNAAQHLEPLKRLGVPLFYSEPHRIDEVAVSLEKLGVLMGTQPVANAAATDLRARLAALTAQYATQPPVKVFYQVWDQPLYTLNGTHIVADVLAACGGVNIFAALPATAPTISIEAVLAANPEVVIAGEREGRSGLGPQVWAKYSTLLAAQRGNLFDISPDLTLRAGSRIIEGTQHVCDALDIARKRRP